MVNHYLLHVTVVILYRDGHGVVVMRGNIDGVLIGEGGLLLSLLLQVYLKADRYDTSCQNPSNILHAGRTELSSIGETSDNGVDNNLGTLFFHPLGKSGKDEC